jgi:hypothetical protein
VARCATESCGRWCPELLVRRGVGTYVDRNWFCSRHCVEQMVRRRLIDARPVAAGIPAVPPMRLGALLRHHGVCGAEAIERALHAQRGSNMKLGEQLFAMGAAEKEGVLRALAAQAGVGYLATIDTEKVREAPGGLSPNAVRALGVVPLNEEENGRIRVACQAPVPRRALSAFRRLTGWSPEAYLVADADFQTLVRNYGADVSGDRPVRELTRFSQTECLSDAAARIATAATRSRHTTVTEARWEPYTWVRVQCPSGRVEDVLFSRPALPPDAGFGLDVVAEAPGLPEEEPCPVVITSH